MSLPNRKYFDHSIPPWIDQGSIFFLTVCCQKRNENQLCVSGVSKVILNAAKFYHEKDRWYVWVILLMPDHLHALVSIGLQDDLSKIVKEWKGFTAKKSGIKWQRGFFDHRLRSDENLQQKEWYIRNNPVRQNLVSKPEDWVFIWTPQIAVEQDCLTLPRNQSCSGS
jgi:putative transposase